MSVCKCLCHFWIHDDRLVHHQVGYERANDFASKVNRKTSLLINLMTSMTQFYY